MIEKMNRTMREAMQLMQSGDLHAATQSILRGLQGSAGSMHVMAEPREFQANVGSIDGEYRVVPDFAHSAVEAPGIAEPSRRDPGSEPDGEFRDHRFTCDAGAVHYKLFIPAGLGAAPPPLIVMLHGCTQSPDDFARGTRMNDLAREHGYVIAYPAQSARRNPGKCWNWFRSEDQQRGRGEPAIIAALTRYLVKRHGLDERRVYVAGLSAGGAMAAVLASTYPDVYAAIGVHSGLPFGVARDLPSAFAAMNQGARMHGAGVTPARMEPVPAIVFHGDRDTTVHPCNGEAVIAQCAGTDSAGRGADNEASRATVERGSVPGGHTYTRTIIKGADGSVAAEQWLVHGAGHAWFGGHPSGSYTDPAGPDASEHMLRFFSARVRPVIN